jgi:hypothetical protein
MYYLPILYFYFTYTIFSPFINSSKILNYTFYKISNLTFKSKLKKFDLNNNTIGNKLLVYTVNDESSKKIINKLQDQIKINKIESDYVIINTCKSLANTNKFELDYVIINCDKNIIYTHSVFEEFFKYTGIDKNKFIKLYNEYENIVLDLNQNEILTFT